VFTAARKGHFEVVQLLAVFGASITTGTTNGRHTPRWIATANGHAALAKWLNAVEAWAPLQIAAGCRLYTAASTALRLGLVDPEQGGVGAMLATRAPAASTAPWGVIIVPPTPDEAVAVPDFDPFIAMAAEAARQRVVALAHVPTCALANKFFRAATSGWSITHHWLHHTTVRNTVHTLALVSERLHQQAAATSVCTTALGLPDMPPELWLAIAHFARRSDWQVVVAELP
jgi:hypothetical protein